jgi:GNAT superfamily N-acetyltransferase
VAFRVRPRNDDELPALVEALARVAAADGYPSRWPADPAGWLRCTRRLGAWVADRDGHPVGHVVLRRPRPPPHHEAPVALWSATTGHPVERAAVLVRLFVVPDARGTGLGGALVAAACAAAADRRLHPVLDVVDANRAAIRLYQRLGWTRLGSYEETFADGGPSDLLHCFAAPPSVTQRE